MPEGDTVWKTAQVQHAALAGKVLDASDFRVPRFATLDLSGETVHAVVARGKHLFHRVGELSIHSHLKMEGVWRTFAPGERWTKPAYTARVLPASVPAARNTIAEIIAPNWARATGSENRSATAGVPGTLALPRKCAIHARSGTIL